ncbi:membrane protein (plasmid) [Fulvitalea axinellae]|uniref:Membrane protein n=1 Tax=Fulvitalea axinellae TaxID=1182444 RepID=A0AAU9DHK9_9BACT|nr:membrane protein [Fulvitalea axinellae]
MFKEFFLRELKGGLKRPMVYIFLVVFGLLVGGAVSSDSVIIGGAVGNIHRNAPHIVTTYTAIMGIFGLLVAAAFFNNAALRDFNNQFHEIIFSTRLRKSDYFFGRFFGALILATIPMLGVFIGVWVGSWLAPLAGWMDPERMGPTNISAFINNYFLFVLPNTFIGGAIIFGLASKFRSTMISFVGAILLIVGYSVANSLMSDVDNETIAGLTDIFGISTYSITSKYFTPAEKNTLAPAFEGLLLWNRLLVMALGAVILGLSYSLFSFKEKQKKAKKKKKKETVVSKMEAILAKPRVTVSLSGASWTQFVSFFKINFLSIFKSTVFQILIVFALIMLIADLWGGYEYYGLQTFPITYMVIGSINSSVLLFLMITMVFFSGELVWRDRGVKINEVIDATPHTSFVSLIAKSVSLICVMICFYMVMSAFGVLYQLGNGFTNINFEQYFVNIFVDKLPTFTVWSFVLILIQVMLPNKYVGYFLSVVMMFVSEIILSILDIDTRMLDIASSPSLSYSDISGYGPGMASTIWFNIYWTLFGLFTLGVAGMLWSRGVAKSLGKRLRYAMSHLGDTNSKVAFASLALFVVAGVYVFYNTQVLNTYKTSDEEEQQSADFEKKYKKYENMPMLTFTDAKYELDLFPERRDVYVKASIRMRNKKNVAVDSMLFIMDDKWITEFEIPGAKEVYFDEEMNLKIFKLAKPVQPSETLDFVIKNKYITQGFENSSGNRRIDSNGTFLSNSSILPAYGYIDGYELSDKHTRKKYDLAPKDRMPKLEANCGEACQKNYLTNGQADLVNVETIISTSGDQTAIAPGSLLKKWEKDGRNYFHYKVDTPSQNFYSFISGRFEKLARKWNGIDIEVYYDKNHAYNVEMMADAVQRSLDYYIKNFGPYYHKQARIIEFPNFSSFAQAFPGTMPYSESMGFIIDLEDAEEKNNFVDAVIAHEMAHQWWAHQEISAKMQGGTFLTESLSEYSSLMVMKKELNDDIRMKEFLKYNFERYLKGRSREREKELPLYKVENQGYIHYGKGSLILYALQDYIGEDSVNVALKDFLEEYRYQEDPPYPTSLDLLRHLEPRVPDSLKYLVNDWFKEITLYDHRLKEATMEETADGKFIVEMEVESHKIKADSLGNEQRLPISDWVDVGLYADSDEKELIVQKRVKLDKEKTIIKLKANVKPAKAAVDPRRILIERIVKDNVKTVSSK